MAAGQVEAEIEGEKHSETGTGVGGWRQRWGVRMKGKKHSETGTGVEWETQ